MTKIPVKIMIRASTICINRQVALNKLVPVYPVCAKSTKFVSRNWEIFYNIKTNPKSKIKTQ
jgi:hypothetical protein